MKYISDSELYTYIKEDTVYNGAIKDGKLELIGINNTENNANFEKEIKEKYEKHVALTSLLGCKTTFSYAIEGKEVILQNYNQSNSNIMIPNFITAIGKSAFFGTGIESVSIGTGVKYIGCWAFAECNIKEIVIPENVEFIGPQAFDQNKRLIKGNGKYTENIKLLGKSTLIINKFDNS